MTRIPKRRIRRWMEGYAFTSSGRSLRSDAVIRADIGRDVGELSLSFADMLEIRFLDAFLQCGVSWASIRTAAATVSEILSREHPFSSKVFKTDGRHILAEIARPGRVPDLLNLVKSQYEFRRVVSPMLYAGIEFSTTDAPERWWPMKRRGGVVLDPQRSFGAPIVSSVGVPTIILSASALAEGSQRMTALIYEVPLSAVRHAIAFEAAFAA